jgi:hypothetical protein
VFVRQKRNASGSISVQVVDKSAGYRVVHTVGSARDQHDILRLVELGHAFIARQNPQLALFPDSQRDNAVILDFLRTLENASIRTVGPELIFGKLFDLIGFNAVPDSLFRDIVIARLVHPVSKLKTVDYLARYQGKAVSVDSVYLALDRLGKRHAKQVQQIAFDHSCKLLKQIGVVFYDMTSLYFEAEDEDDLRKIGFSKDGKFQNPQILLGLLVGENGFPIGYDIFEGNTFEGKTLLPVLRRISKRYDLGKPIVVADAAMLSTSNLDQLKRAGHSFIVAARIHNESDRVRAQILERCQNLTSGQSVTIDHPDGHRLIVAHSDKRARKDAHNRKRGIDRLRKRIAGGTLTKSHINGRGYNKFLQMKGDVALTIDEQKIQQAARWDGLKGYLTNTDLSADQVIESYGQLWQIEKAFRISKTDLRIRPIFHRKRKRIEAHVLIAFVAYTIYKELERRLREAKIDLSPQRAAELSQTIYALMYQLPGDPTPRQQLLRMSYPQQQLHDLLN